jgi:hypothetical protein
MFLTRLLSHADIYRTVSHVNMSAQRTTLKVPLPRVDGLPSRPPGPPPRLPFRWTPPTKQQNPSLPTPAAAPDGQFNRLTSFAAERSMRMTTSSIRDSFQNHLRAQVASGGYLTPCVWVEHQQVLVSSPVSNVPKMPASHHSSRPSPTLPSLVPYNVTNKIMQLLEH